MNQITVTAHGAPGSGRIPMFDEEPDAPLHGECAAEIARLTAENERLNALINTPELDQFLRAVHLEAIHQVERWGTAGDRAKRPADWFWLVGYLSGKALHSQIAADMDKAVHHTISTAAALYNWHCAIKGNDVRMCPGSSDVARIVDGAFPGEAVTEPEARAIASINTEGETS